MNYYLYFDFETQSGNSYKLPLIIKQSNNVFANEVYNNVKIAFNEQYKLINSDNIPIINEDDINKLIKDKGNKISNNFRYIIFRKIVFNKNITIDFNKSYSENIIIVQNLLSDIHLSNNYIDLYQFEDEAGTMNFAKTIDIKYGLEILKESIEPSSFMKIDVLFKS